jgi:hypothetical protein
MNAIFYAEFHVIKTNKQTPWTLVRKRNIPTERPPVVEKFSATFVDRGVSRGQGGGSLTVANLSFLDALYVTPISNH